MAKPTTKANPLAVAEKPRPSKSEAELAIERLAKMNAAELTGEDLWHLQKIRDRRAGLREIEKELTENRETKKARVKALDEAITEAANHFEHRQLAKQLKLDL